MFIGLLWKNILFSYSWPKNIWLKLYLIASTIFYKVILLLLSSINIVSHYSVSMTEFATITKLIRMDSRSLNNVLTLEKCRKTYKSRYYVLDINFDDNADLTTIIILATSLEVNSS